RMVTLLAYAVEQLSTKSRDSTSCPVGAQTGTRTCTVTMGTGGSIGQGGGGGSGSGSGQGGAGHGSGHGGGQGAGHGSPACPHGPGTMKSSSHGGVKTGRGVEALSAHGADTGVVSNGAGSGGVTMASARPGPPPPASSQTATSH